MALYCVNTGSIALSSAATKSLVLVNPATAAFKLREVDLSFDGSAAAAGIRVELYRVATIGSPAGTTATPAQADERDIAAQSTALTALSAEPTTVTVMASWLMQQLGGLLPLPFPFGAEPIGKGAGQRLGVRAVTPASVTPNVACNFWFEE